MSIFFSLSASLRNTFNHSDLFMEPSAKRPCNGFVKDRPSFRRRLHKRFLLLQTRMLKLWLPDVILDEPVLNSNISLHSQSLGLKWSRVSQK